MKKIFVPLFTFLALSLFAPHAFASGNTFACSSFSETFGTTDQNLSDTSGFSVGDEYVKMTCNNLWTSLSGYNNTNICNSLNFNNQQSQFFFGYGNVDNYTDWINLDNANIVDYWDYTGTNNTCNINMYVDYTGDYTDFNGDGIYTIQLLTNINPYGFGTTYYQHFNLLGSPSSFINNPSVVSSITAPSIQPINTSLTASASFSDVNTTDTHIAVWNWGDGSTSNGTVTESNGSGSVSDNHTYTSLGSFTVTLTVTDSEGLSSMSQTVISVIPANGLAGGNLSHTNFSGADLSNQNISKANLSVATFNNVDFQSANLSQVNGSNSSFINDTFTGANLTKVNFSNSNFSGSNFTNAIITQGNLSNANVTNANFTGANLQGANFSGTTKTGIIWSNTICPNGKNSDSVGGTCVGQGGGL